MILDYLLDVDGSINAKISLLLFYKSMRNRPGEVLIRLGTKSVVLKRINNDPFFWKCVFVTVVMFVHK
jgi:hypothetical protein